MGQPAGFCHCHWQGGVTCAASCAARRAHAVDYAGGAEGIVLGFRGSSMGIQNFHSWVDAKFAASTKADGPLTCDHLLVDLNSLVHAAARKASTPREAIKRILKRLDALEHPHRPGATIRARRSVGLFSDGPAPLAKLARRRRPPGRGNTPYRPARRETRSPSS